MSFDVGFAVRSPENERAEMARYTAEMRVRNLEEAVS